MRAFSAGNYRCEFVGELKAVLSHDEIDSRCLTKHPDSSTQQNHSIESPKNPHDDRLRDYPNPVLLHPTLRTREISIRAHDRDVLNEVQGRRGLVASDRRLGQMKCDRRQKDPTGWDDSTSPSTCAGSGKSRGEYIIFSLSCADKKLKQKQTKTQTQFWNVEP